MLYIRNKYAMSLCLENICFTFKLLLCLVQGASYYNFNNKLHETGPTLNEMIKLAC